ncbi:hypothetical protein SAY86_009782 [Trapa natans]|uniref:Transcription repressor n=1 Tax=Trapa natans TaxID=22666 RepID=A0AAN7L5G4_TRANT|nr:hypothetical protein SAY86_009782 [Trapa natans]
MPKKKLQSSLRDYISKIKNRPAARLQSPKSFIVSGCKHPKTRSFAANQTPPDNEAASKDKEAALEDIDQFLFENFRSLYLHDDEDIPNCKENLKDVKGKGLNNTSAADLESFTGSILFDSPTSVKPPRDKRESRGFYAGPQSSSSMDGEAWSSTTSNIEVTTNTKIITSDSSNIGSRFIEFTTSNSNSGSINSQKEAQLPENTIAVLAPISLPYDGFMHSMREMAKSRMETHGQLDWNFMEELLFCYMNLNEKRSHTYILKALVDLIMELRQSRGRCFPSHWESGEDARWSRLRSADRQ